MISEYHSYKPDATETILEQSISFATVLGKGKRPHCIRITEMWWNQDHRRKGNQGEWEPRRSVWIENKGLDKLKMILNSMVIGE